MPEQAVAPIPVYGRPPSTKVEVLREIAELVCQSIPAAGGRAAFQGPSRAMEEWLVAGGDKDLDIWADRIGYAMLADFVAERWGARVQHADDPRRLEHSAWIIETLDGPALLDVTVGDLCVGPLTLVREAHIETVAVEEESGPVCSRLAGVAAAADLLVRPLFRGRVPEPDRLAEARRAWAASGALKKMDFELHLRGEVGDDSAEAIIDVLDREEPPDSLLSTLRKAYIRSTLRSLPAAWKQRDVIIPAGRRAGIAGVRARGVLVVLVGTDGSGKSTVAGKVAERLEGMGIPTSHAYMGMARGNLPGVGLVRRLLRIPAPEVLAESQRQDDSPTAPPAGAAAMPTLEQARSGLAHPGLRKVAAWFYAAEYLVRYARDIRPNRRVGGQPAVVIADRYVYDLMDSPWPGSRAARVARRFMPRPDVLLVPDASDDVIHARKPERPAHEQAAQQAGFRTLAAEQPARFASMLVDTSGSVDAGVDPIAPVVGAIIGAMHGEA